MFCKNCGNEIKEGELNCAACGTPASQPQVQQPEQAPQQPQYQAPQQPQYQVPPQPQYQQPYAKPANTPSQGVGLSVMALVFGICGIVLGSIPFFIVAALSGLGIVFGAMGLKKSSTFTGRASGLAIAGLVLAIIGTVIAVPSSLCTTTCTCECIEAVSDPYGYLEDAYDDFDDIYDDLYSEYY